MSRYELSRSADRDLEGIYTYTYHRFGEFQADAYFESLEECLAALATNPLMGTDSSNIRGGYRRMVHQRHTVYYKKAKSKVIIVRVLGPGMSAGRAFK